MSLISVGAISVAAVGAVAWGSARWNRSTARALAQLSDEGAESSAPAATYSPEQLTGLPLPVQRYFQFALTPGQPLVRRARLEQSGTFRVSDRWAPFTALEHFSVQPPGFLWDARIQMAPAIAVRVRDSYLDGEGAMHGSVGGLLTVVDQRGTPEMAAGTLVRYLAEAAWLPSALLPSAGVVWTPVDDTTANATLKDGKTTASLQFHFGTRGEIVSATTTRYRDVGGRAVLTPWLCHFYDYERRGGMMIPMAGVVEWVLPGGPLPYWRGRLADVRY